MSIVVSIAAFLGRFTKEVLPIVFDEMKKPRKIRFIGGSKKVKNEVNQSVTDAIESDIARGMRSCGEEGHSDSPSGRPSVDSWWRRIFSGVGIRRGK